MNSNSRFVTLMVDAIFVYVGIEYLIERRRAFLAWRESFVAPFLRHPGRREFLRESLMLEELRDA
jgi:hypothetical protein